MCIIHSLRFRQAILLCNFCCVLNVMWRFCVMLEKKSYHTAEIINHYAGASSALATSLKGASVIVF